ncbi:MAG: LysE family translocator [Neomegalonema sp.]|nr:LysE family translocator [Neomegalonema sp.]
MISLEFMITAFIVVIAPGTGVIYTIAVGLGAGRAASIAAAFGCTLGIAPAMAAAAIVVSAILYASALLFTAVKFIGAAYLLYLGWLTLQDSGPLSIAQGRGQGRSAYKIAKTGFLINVLNPKLAAFFMAFLPQFIDAASPTATLRFMLLGSVFMAMTFVVFALYGVFAAQLGRYVLRRPSVMTWMRRTIALTFGAFALRLALSERA